nr:GNAT family N-acetyltransferase [Thiocystis violacea]
MDRYFRDHVTQDIRRRLSHGFVLLDARDELAGYYTFAATSVPVNELPADLTQRLPRYPSLPAGLIGRLAIDRRFQRQGLGSLLIADAVSRAIMTPLSACPALIAASGEGAQFRFLRVLRRQPPQPAHPPRPSSPAALKFGRCRWRSASAPRIIRVKASFR